MNLLAALRALSKLADFFRWAVKSLRLSRADAIHAANRADINAAINRLRNPSNDGQQPGTVPPLPPSTTRSSQGGS